VTHYKPPTPSRKIALPSDADIGPASAPSDKATSDAARFQLAAIVESSDDAIISKSLDGTILSWNHAAELLYGYSPAETVGNSIEMLVPRDRPDEVHDVLATIEQGGHMDHFETERLHKDGSLVPVSLMISPIIDDTGEVTGASAIARDLTERFQTLKRLALAAEYRDDTTHEHAERVGRTCALLARALGLPDQEVDELRHAAPLHDIGKVGVPDAILLKPGKLTADQFTVMKRHCVIGRQILADSDSRVMMAAETIALTHHERWDGSGYPNGLEGTAIPLAGRIVAVADVFDALAHKRPYKEAWALDEVVREISRLSGTHFDPDLVLAFEGMDHQTLLAPIAEDAVESY
jgi:putative two-component system response regulator